MGKLFLSIIIAVTICNCGIAQSNLEEFKNLSNLELIKEGNQLMEIKLPSINGKIVDLNDLRGKYVFINFWATWCAACIKNMPFFEELIGEYEKDNIEFVFVSIDKSKEKWEGYVFENKLKGMQLFAPEGDKTKPICFFLNRVYQEDGQITAIEKGIPRYVLIDSKGIILENDLDKKTKEEIKILLNEKLN